MIRPSEVLDRLLGFDERWKAVIRMVLGCIWTASSIVLVLVAFNVKALEEGRDKDHSRERATVRTACERSQVFGLPLITHIERVERKLHTGALVQADGQPVEVEYPQGSRKYVSVLGYYRQSIPKVCPK